MSEVPPYSGMRVDYVCVSEKSQARVLSSVVLGSGPKHHEYVQTALVVLWCETLSVNFCSRCSFKRTDRVVRINLYYTSWREIWNSRPGTQNPEA